MRQWLIRACTAGAFTVLGACNAGTTMEVPDEDVSTQESAARTQACTPVDANCPRDRVCSDDPRDRCDPQNGGTDCPYACIKWPRHCDDDPARSYISSSTATCTIVRFSCPEGSAGFSDECGCGCVTVSTP